MRCHLSLCAPGSDSFVSQLLESGESFPFVSKTTSLPQECKLMLNSNDSVTAGERSSSPPAAHESGILETAQETEFSETCLGEPVIFICVELYLRVSKVPFPSVLPREIRSVALLGLQSEPVSLPCLHSPVLHQLA